jgi:hypothetical protein
MACSVVTSAGGHGYKATKSWPPNSLWVAALNSLHSSASQHPILMLRLDCFSKQQNNITTKK